MEVKNDERLSTMIVVRPLKSADFPLKLNSGDLSRQYPVYFEDIITLGFLTLPDLFLSMIN